MFEPLRFHCALKSLVAVVMVCVCGGGGGGGERRRVVVMVLVVGEWVWIIGSYTALQTTLLYLCVLITYLSMAFIY